MAVLNCLRCGTPMEFAGKEKLQLGQTGWILGDLPNLLAGALEVRIYQCPDCGRLEFFAVNETTVPAAKYRDETLPAKQCPTCDATIDFDYPKCPHCGHVF